MMCADWAVSAAGIIWVELTAERKVELELFGSAWGAGVQTRFLEHHILLRHTLAAFTVIHRLQHCRCVYQYNTDQGDGLTAT